MQSIIDQICKPFGWIVQIDGEAFGIYTQNSTGQYYRLAHGSISEIDPWKVRSVAMFTYWYLLTQGVQLPPIEITLESVQAMEAEDLKVQSAAPQNKSQRIVGPEHFLADPADIKSYVGASRIQHAPPATMPIGYTEDGSLEIRPGASPRRVMDNRLNW